MKVLLVGGGGREHALCWALAESPLLTKLWCAPGNAGIAELAECVPIGAEDIAGLVAFAREQGGRPGGGRAGGAADRRPRRCLRRRRASAASARAPRRRGWKAARPSHARSRMPPACPAPRWRRFDDAAAARAYLREQGAPIVVKADGLAAGKGVVVAATVAEAEAAVADIMESRVHGAAGAAVVDRGMPGRRGSLLLRALRRRGGAAARRGAGPQAGRRGRHRPEYRRHGRLFAAARLHRRAARRGDGAHHPARPGRDGAARHALPRRPVRRADADRDRPAA